jgi:hypothetical protein
MRTTIEHALLVTFLSLVAACGGKVVFSEGTGGAGGEGGSTSDVATSTSDAATSTSDVATSSVAVTNGSSSSGGKTVCQEYCDQFANCVGSPDECVQDCSFSLGQGCDAQLESAIECLVTAIDPQTCDYQGQCDQLVNELDACLNGSTPPPGQCFTEMATGTDTSCKASGTCFDTTVTVSCDVASNGSIFCSCFAADVAATCQQNSLDCFLESSCCISALFGG